MSRPNNHVDRHRIRYLTKSLDPARSGLPRRTGQTIVPPYLMDSDVEESSSSGGPRCNAENRVSSEYTPLLEDFTERFINRSQNILQTSGSVASGAAPANNDTNSGHSVPVSFVGQQLSVPPELLLIHHQQSPFNPNLIASDSSSLSSISFGSQVEVNYGTDGGTSPDQTEQDPPATTACSRLFIRFKQTFWLICQTALIISLMAFNFGSVLTPQLYSAFFNPYDDQEQLVDDETTLAAERGKNGTNHEDFRLFLINFTAMTFIQIFMAVLATVSSLILLYAACKVLHRIRKRLLFHMKHRTFVGNPDSGSLGTESSKTMLTMETIVAETMGVTLARILSLIIVIHQFCLCTIYIYILYDYSDMFVAKLPWLDISERFCQLQVWYLNHDVICSTLLTAVVAIFFGLASLRVRRKMQESSKRDITRLYSLWLLKILATVIGLMAIIFVPVVIAQLYPIFQLRPAKSAQRFRSPPTMDSYPRWTGWLPIKKQNDWIALFGTLPLMLLPFQLNEILIMLLFSQYNDSYYRPRPLSSNRSSTRNSEQEPLYGSISKSTLYPGLPDVTDNQEQNGGPSLYLASFKSIGSSRTSFFFKSFGTIRNWFLVVAILGCLLQIVLNIFYFHWTYQTQPEMGATIDINFIREYLSAAHVDSTSVWICAGILFLKTTVLYLLMLFRGVLALQQGLFGSYQRRPTTANEQQETSNESRFQIIAPYLIWNCLCLIMALVVQDSPATLQLVIWLIGLFAIILVLLYPSMLLCYFATKTLGQLNATNGGTHRLSVEWSLQQFRPLRWPRLFLMFGVLMAAIALFYLGFWVYGYGRHGAGSFDGMIIDLHDHFHQVPMSLVTFIRRQTSSDSLFCNHSTSISLLPN